MSAPDKPVNWSDYMFDIYESGNPPLLGSVRFEDIEAQAREKLKDHPEAFMYANGSAGTNSTYRANLAEFQAYRIIPRMLVDATERSLETTIFGVRHPSPLFIAPIGVQAIFSAEAELAPARAAQALRIPYIMSTASARSIEEVAQANGTGHRWFQLYWCKSDDVTLSLLSRAQKSGFSALVVTLDTFVLGWRPHDLGTAYIPFAHGVGIQVGTSDPVFMARHGLPVDASHPAWPYDPRAVRARIAAGDEKARQAAFLGREWLGECNSGVFRSWEDIRFLRRNWTGPLVLKGIQSVEDAETALEYGVDGIVVSNHGGRQVDGAIASLTALAAITQSPKIRAAQDAGKLTVLFDSGVRTGSDVLKAIALGAQGVLLGRPWLHGAVLAGQAGVEQVLRQTLADLHVSLGLAGHKSLDTVRGRREILAYSVGGGKA